MRRNRLNLFLLLLVTVLGVLAWLRPGLEQAPPARISDLDAAAVQQIRILHDGETLVLEREGDHWRLAGDPPVPADRFQVDTLLGLLAEVAVRSYDLTDLDTQAVGLEPPVAVIEFDGQPFRFGATEPLEGLRYLQVGDRIHLIDDRYGPLLRASRAQLASRRLLPPGTRLSAILLPGQRLERDEQGHWQLDPPQPTLSADDIQQFVTAWEEARALWVRSAEDTEDAGDAVQLRTATGEGIRFLIRRDDEGTALLRPALGLAYRLSEATATELLALPQPNEAAGDSEVSPAASVPADGPPRDPARP